MNIIAEIKMPKQRATRQFGYIITNTEDHYSVHRIYYDGGSLTDGHYDLTWEEAFNTFKAQADYILSYGSDVYEIASEV